MADDYVSVYERLLVPRTELHGQVKELPRRRQ
jgi:hypothetical protein